MALGAGCDADASSRSGSDAAQPSDAHAAAGPDLTSDDAARAVDAAVPVAADLSTGLPGFRVRGAWHGGGRDGVCTRLHDETTCVVAGWGRATLHGAMPAGPGVREHVTVDAVAEGAGADTVEAVEVVTEFALDDATAWISSGFQSWSQSGAVALGEAVEDAALEAALGARGDAEVLRDGRALSWWYTAIGGGASTVEARVDDPTSRVGKGWFQVSRPAGSTRVRLRMAVGGDGDSAASGGFDVDWHLGAGSSIALSAAPSARVPALFGWNSWYELYEAVDEPAVRANAERMAEIIASRPALADTAARIVIDDGWQRGWGDWQANEKFPEGVAPLAAALAGDGFTLGLWMAPFLVSESDPRVVERPSWFVEGLVFPHLVNGPMRVLDITHPDARSHLLNALLALSAQGVGLFKLDFLFAGTWPGTRHTAMTGMAAYTLFWQSVRDALPPETVLIAVGAPPLPTLDFADAWRVGNDIAVPNFGVAWAFFPNQLRSLAARQPFCARGQCDADPVLLRTQARAQVEFGAWLVAAAGGGLFLSDDLRGLDPGRVEWGLADAVVAGAMGRGATPESLFPTEPPVSLVSGFSDAVARKSRHAVPIVWRFLDGPRVAFNVGDMAVEVEGVAVSPRSVSVLP